MKHIFITIFLALFLSISLLAQGTTQYIYDANGRLTHVISPSGQVSVYEYDSAGNLTRIRNEQNPILLISNFSPSSGSAGTQVTIRGVGFSIIPAQNEVKFNGISTTVLSSTLTELVVTVPIGATTGKIQVTNPTGTAISQSNFVIDSSIPIINSFSPILGKVDDVVNINGSGYSSDIEENVVKFYQSNAQVLNSTYNQITTKVPNNAVSGKIKVSNDKGETASNDYFFVVPSNFNVSDVSQTAKLNYDEKYQVNIPKTKKLSLFVFEGTTGDRVYVSLKNLIGNPYLKVYTPSNTLIWNWWNSADLILPETGTYTVSVESADELPVSLSLSVIKDRKINTDGTPETAYLLNQGQNIELNFQAKAGQNFNLKISNATAVAANFSVISPSGQTIYSDFIDSIYTGSFATFSTNESGNHKIVYDPILNVTGYATFELNLLNDIGGNLIINDPPKTFTSKIAGQGFRINFAGNSNQRFYLKTTTNDFYTLKMTIRDSNEIDLITDAEFSNEVFIDLNNLPNTGQYTMIIYPNFPNQFGELTLQAVDNNIFVPDNPSQRVHAFFFELPLGGRIKTPSKNNTRLSNLPTATYLLNAKAEQLFSFTTAPPPSQRNKAKNNRNLVGGNMTIYKPNGDELNSTLLDIGFCNLTLPDAGQYQIVVAPQTHIVDRPKSPNSANADFILRIDCGGSPDRPIKNNVVKKGVKK